MLISISAPKIPYRSGATNFTCSKKNEQFNKRHKTATDHKMSNILEKIQALLSLQYIIITYSHFMVMTALFYSVNK